LKQGERGEDFKEEKGNRVTRYDGAFANVGGSYDEDSGSVMQIRLRFGSIHGKFRVWIVPSPSSVSASSSSSSYSLCACWRQPLALIWTLGCI